MTHPTTLPCPTCKTDVPVNQDDCQECGMKIRVTRPVPQADRIRVTCELMEAGIEHYRQWITSKHPEVSEAEINAMVWAWRLQDDESSAVLPRTAYQGDGTMTIGYTGATESALREQLRREQDAIQAMHRRQNRWHGPVLDLLWRKPWRSPARPSWERERSFRVNCASLWSWLRCAHDCADPSVACSCSGGFRHPNITEAGR